MKDNNEKIGPNGGNVLLPTGERVQWETARGGQSSLEIYNASHRNELRVNISGIANKLKAKLGEKEVEPNGRFTLRPNDSNHRYSVIGDFRGARVVVSNMTVRRNPADAQIDYDVPQD